MPPADHRSRDALIDVGIALSRTIDLERVVHEVARQVQRAIPCDAFVIALADDETAALRVLHQIGFADDAAAATRFTPAWLEALANNAPIHRLVPGGAELTAPMTSTEGVLGAMSLLSPEITQGEEAAAAARLLYTIASQTEAAIERAELVRRVEGKRRLEAIGEVAAGVAHELRNPLFGISSAAQLLRFQAKDDPIVEKNVGRILREVDRLNRMVGALLEYGRPHALRPAPGDPDLVWDEVLESLRGRLEGGGLTVARTRAAPPVRCPVDAEQLAQVFINILVNAVDAAPGGATLTLTSQAHGHGGWRCRLHNPGPPIPAEVLHRVFEIFFSTKPGGTGIGLALCQRIVEEHGGTIAIESAAASGTAVTITLPAAP